MRALTVALTFVAAAAAPYVTLGVVTYGLDGESASVLTLDPASGVTGATAPPAAFPPSLTPCSTAYVPADVGGAPALFVVPAFDGSALTLVAAAGGAVLRTVPLVPQFLLPTLSFSAGDGLLYGVGVSATDPGPFLSLVSVNASTGAVTAIAPLLSDNVLECAGGVDAASGLWAFSYTGPLSLQVIAGGTAGNAAADGFSVAVTVGAVMSVAPATLPGAGGAVVLFLAVDDGGALNALYALDPATGNVTALAPLNATFTKPGQGALVFDAARGTAAALVQLADGSGDALIAVDLRGAARDAVGRPALPAGAAAVSYVRLADAAVAPQGVWGLAVAA